MALRRLAELAGVALGTCVAFGALAQDYPAKPLRFLVGFAAGGPTDVIARRVAQDMTPALGQLMVVENRSGANAIIATEVVAGSAADGHTLRFSSLSLLVNALLPGAKVEYDPFRDFAPVSNGANLPMVIVAAVGQPFGTMAELIALAKSKPDAVVYGTSGIGGSSHLAGAMREHTTGRPDLNRFKAAPPRKRQRLTGLTANTGTGCAH